MDDAMIVPPGYRQGAMMGNPPTQRRTRGSHPGAPNNPLPVPGMPRCDMTTYTYSTTANEAQQVGDYNENRGYFMVQNNGAANIYVSFGSQLPVGQGYLIRPGGFYEPLSVPASEIFVISGSTNVAYTVILGNDI